ncbi:hypothetical protein EJ110_NYTH07202, partial [Nymphaea thermarum]
PFNLLWFSGGCLGSWRQTDGSLSSHWRWTATDAYGRFLHLAVFRVAVTVGGLTVRVAGNRHPTGAWAATGDGRRVGGRFLHLTIFRVAAIFGGSIALAATNRCQVGTFAATGDGWRVGDGREGSSKNWDVNGEEFNFTEEDDLDHLN